jgi:MFS family permease
VNTNVWLIAFSNAAGFCATPLLMFVGSIVGAQLAPSADLATIPIAAMVIGTAVGTLPVSLLMGTMGRKPTYILFILLGAVACGLAGVALGQKSFTLFCLSAALVGVSNAAIQQLRFAAMESVSPEKGPTAASVVLCGGIVVAFVGPELAVLGQFLTAVPYQGSFWLVSGSFILSAAVLSMVKLREATADVNQAPARPMLQILASPSFCLAVASATIAYMIMSFVMTATPISMHHHHGHSLVDTKWVIQSHIAAMFLPSLIGPILLRLISIKGLMVAGLVAYTITIGLGYLDTSVSGYWFQLVLLGIGWNFLFLAGTSLLPTTYRDGEQFKARGFNDGFVFSAQAVASLSAGWVIHTTNWQNLLILCFAPILVLVFVLVLPRSRVVA